MSINRSRSHSHRKLHNSINRKKNILPVHPLPTLSLQPPTPSLCAASYGNFSCIESEPDIRAEERKIVYSHGWKYANVETTQPLEDEDAHAPSLGIGWWGEIVIQWAQKKTEENLIKMHNAQPNGNGKVCGTE